MTYSFNLTIIHPLKMEDDTIVRAIHKMCRANAGYDSRMKRQKIIKKYNLDVCEDSRVEKNMNVTRNAIVYLNLGKYFKSKKVIENSTSQQLKQIFSFYMDGKPI